MFDDISFSVNEFSFKSFFKTFVSEIGVFLTLRNFIDRNALLTIMRPSITNPNKYLPIKELICYGFIEWVFLKDLLRILLYKFKEVQETVNLGL